MDTYGPFGLAGHVMGEQEDNIRHTMKTTALLEEPCNCGDRVMHHNGGNYHRRIRLHTLVTDDSYVVLLEDTTTREHFPGDNYQYLVKYPDGFELIDELVYDMDVEDGRAGPILARFLAGEAEIIAQGG